MIIESTDPSELAQDNGDSDNEDAVMAALLSKGEQEQPETEDQGQEEAPQADDAEEVEQAEDQPEDEDPEIEIGDLKLRKSEWRAGHMKEKDYRQKTAEVAEAKRQTQALAEQIAAERLNSANQLDVFLETLYGELVGDQEALAELARTDPAEWVAQNAAFQKRVQKFNEATQHRQSLQGRITADDQRKQAEWRKEQRDLLHSKLPEWADPAKAGAEQKIIAQYAFDQGYSAEELGELFDHRALLVLRDAALFRAQQAAAKSAKDKQVKQEPAKVVKAGAAKTTQDNQSQRTAYQEALAKARKSGRSEDVERVLMMKGT